MIDCTRCGKRLWLCTCWPTQTGKVVVAAALGLLVAAAPALAQETRIDTFDRHSNRTGYLILNPRTGRLDSYDTKSNHTGYSIVTPPPASVRPGQNVYVTPVPGGVSKRR